MYFLTNVSERGKPNIHPFQIWCLHHKAHNYFFKTNSNKSLFVLFVCVSGGVCAYGSMGLLGGRLPLDSSWSHMDRRWQLWSLSGCAVDICHTGHPLPPVCNNPPHRLQGGGTVNTELRLGWYVKRLQLQTHEWHSWSKHLNGFISGHPSSPAQSMYNYSPCERGNCRAEEMKVRLLSAQIWVALLILPVRPSESRPRFNLFQLLWYIFTFNSAVINNGGSSDKYILFPRG